MRITFNRQKGFLVHVNGRSEFHGEERQPAGDVRIRASMPNAFLDQIHGTLKHALYFHDTANPQNDLADKAMEGNPDHLPHLRFPFLKGPLRTSEEMVGGKLIVHHGVGGRSDLVLADIKVNDIQLMPKAGGTVEVSFRAQGHPDEKLFGRLYTMIQTEVEFTLEPPKAEEDLAAAPGAPLAAVA